MQLYLELTKSYPYERRPAVILTRRPAACPRGPGVFNKAAGRRLRNVH